MRLEPYWPYTTPESKRELAAHYRAMIKSGAEFLNLDPDFWEALATLQEQGRLDEWKATLKRWEDARPHPRDLV